MYNTKELCGTSHWISLQDATYSEDIHVIQDHTAVSDCILCLELINKSLK
jgi:hypothetical protein